MNVLKREGRVRWTHKEDEILKTAYKYLFFNYKKSNHASGEWNEIAKELFFSYPETKNFKTPKNCRERWNNHLNNEVKKEPFSEEEDIELLRSIKEKGKKWSLIAKEMGNRRTEHQIKNRFNSLIGQYLKIIDLNNNNESNKSTKKHHKQELKIEEEEEEEEILLSNNNNKSENNIIDMLLRELERKTLLLLSNSNNHVDNLSVDNNNSNKNSKNIKITINNNGNKINSKSNKNNNNNNNSFPFLNSINVIKEPIEHEQEHEQEHEEEQFIEEQEEKQEQHQSESEEHPFLSYNINNNTNNDNFLNPHNKRSTSTFPILLKPSFESNQSQEEKREYMTSGGMTLVYCGNNKGGNSSNVFDNLFDNLTNSSGNNSNNRSINAVIEDKLFGSQWMSSSEYNKSDNLFIHLTPCAFFEDSSYNEKKMSEFKLSQKGSFEKSEIAASMEYFRLPGSDISQEYRILTSSTVNDDRMSGPMIYEFSNDIKEL